MKIRNINYKNIKRNVDCKSTEICPFCTLTVYRCLHQSKAKLLDSFQATRLSFRTQRSPGEEFVSGGVIQVVPLPLSPSPGNLNALCAAMCNRIEVACRPSPRSRFTGSLHELSALAGVFISRTPSHDTGSPQQTSPFAACLNSSGHPTTRLNKRFSFASRFVRAFSHRIGSL